MTAIKTLLGGQLVALALTGPLLWAMTTVVDGGPIVPPDVGGPLALLVWYVVTASSWSNAMRDDGAPPTLPPAGVGGR